MEGVFLSSAREALLVVVMASAPPLLAALVVGLAVAIVQALTQVQEQTLGVLARIVAVFGTLYVSGYWMAGLVMRFAQKVLTEFPTWVH
jgi:type III secretion protein S